MGSQEQESLRHFKSVLFSTPSTALWWDTSRFCVAGKVLTREVLTRDERRSVSFSTNPVKHR